VFTTHHTAARLLIQQSRTSVGNAFARPWAADHGALAVGGVCPSVPVNRADIGISRGDPAPS
jgi:hypothetical protein